MDEHESAVLFVQILSAIAHLHAHGVVHRDIKPENFLFAWQEPERKDLPPRRAPLKLIDFGLSRQLAKEVEEQRQQRMTPRIGTSEYMAPEMEDGTITTGTAAKSDMWSLGVVLHAMLTGHFPNANLKHQPSDGYFSSAFWKRFSENARDFLQRLVDYRPEKRMTALEAMKHPWLATSAYSDFYKSSRNIPEAIRTFVSMPKLRRMVLLAAAREVDDRDLCAVRSLFHIFQRQCNGKISREALLRSGRGGDAWDADLQPIALELHTAFASLDVNCSGNIDWTALVAASLCSGDSAHGAAGCDDDSNYEGAAGAGVDDMESGSALVFRTFDLLSKGTGAIYCENAGGASPDPNQKMVPRRFFLT
jgi:calcium-dependent protein kinase